MQDFEKLGAFYLGRACDPQTGKTRDELLLYESKDLTTHAVCVGMTGSGKTGLCVSLLEEAAIDGIPAIAIDLKGDLANLMLTFPELRPADFRPWVDPAEGSRRGLDPEAYAAEVARTWKQGLAEWGQDGSRIARFRDAVETAIYTPGSSAGRPLRVLRSLSAPSAQLAADPDALRDRILATVSGLLSLLGIEADPIRSREHILVSNLVERAWREGRDLELAALIAEIQSPPFDRIGVLDLESFFPSKDRFALAMIFNNLLASPGFAAWMEGEPLDVGRLLHTPEGRPRLSILCLAHLSDPERMFFVTQLLNEVVSWMRTQPGTSSLRALLYMDEIFGYFPPTANPPSKLPMLTLLKQARAFGLGVVLATQNPVDLDYKGLSNAGTWLLGRLQTERDKARVLDGLEAATASVGARLDRREIDRMLSGLPSRVFLMNNVHDDAPVLFKTRWAMSYLRGPLSREQIRTLSGAGVARPEPHAAPVAPVAPRERLETTEVPKVDRPLLPPDVPERFAACGTAPGPGARLVYRPGLLGSASLHYVDRRADVDCWKTLHVLAPLPTEVPPDPWDATELLPQPLALEEESDREAQFADLPAPALRAQSYPTWGKRLVSWCYRNQSLPLYACPSLKRYSTPDQGEGEFQAALLHAARERRDLEIEKLRKRYAPKLAQLQDRIARAEHSLAREQEQHQQQKLQTAVSIGATVLGALFGRKAASVGTIGRASTALGRAGRIGRERADVKRAGERIEDFRDQLRKLEAEFEASVEEAGDRIDPSAVEIEAYPVRPRKSDIAVDAVSLVWVPWWVSAEGIATRAL